MATLFSVLSGVAAAQSRAAVERYSIDWQNLPLADAIERIEGVTHVPIFVDRRVDVNRRISFSTANASVQDILFNLAAAADVGAAKIGTLYYLGPRLVAERLPELAAQRRRDAAALGADLRGALTARQPLDWPRLTEPRGLVTRLVEAHGWRAERSALIPHDLWAAGELPTLQFVDQLTLLLAGFDLTYRLHPKRQTLELASVRWRTIDKSSPRRQSASQTRQPATSQQVFTLRVENQPVGKVLEQLASRLGWKLDVDETAIRAAGLSLDRLVSFEVENADEDQLLAALLTPAGLSATARGDRVQIAPK